MSSYSSSALTACVLKNTGIVSIYKILDRESLPIGPKYPARLHGTHRGQLTCTCSLAPPGGQFPTISPQVYNSHKR